MTNISHEQVIEIMACEPKYANKFFFSIADNTVRITFAEENNVHGIVSIRNANVMSINGFMALVSMLNSQAREIEKIVADKAANNSEALQ